jgi:serine/threonine protein kinase
MSTYLESYTERIEAEDAIAEVLQYIGNIQLSTDFVMPSPPYSHDDLCSDDSSVLSSHSPPHSVSEDCPPQGFSESDSEIDEEPDSQFVETDEILGEGTFGKVIVVTNAQGERFAKKICTNKKYIAETRSEMETMQTLSQYPEHSGYYHIVHLVAAIEDSRKEGLELVMDLYEGCLLDLMRDENNRDVIIQLDEKIVRNVARDISLALSYMNKCGIVHGDIKPENILWQRNRFSPSGYHFALADFGISCNIKENKSIHMHIQTNHYRCIENILDEPLHYSCDMTSLGCVLYEAITGDYLVDEEDEYDHISQMLERIGTNEFANYDIAEFPSVRTHIRRIQSVFGDLRTEGTECHDRLFAVFKDKKYTKVPEFLDFIIRSIIPFPEQRLQAKDACKHPLVHL